MKCDDRYRVIRDTREKVGQGWEFASSTRCSGTLIQKLDTGDYTLVGLEGRFVIERKGAVVEYVNNLFEDRFEAELVRLDSFEHPYLLLEFSLADLMRYPEGTGIPKHKWRYLRVTPPLIMKCHQEIQLRHPRLRMEFVGAHGKEYASCLFKRVADLVPL